MFHTRKKKIDGIYEYLKNIYIYIYIMNFYEPHKLWCFYFEEPYIEKSSCAFK